MFGLYFSDYLLKNGLIQKDDLDEILFCPYHEFIQKFIENKSYSLNDVNELISDFQNKYNLSSEQLEAIKSGDMEKSIQAFIRFDPTFDKEKNLKAYQLNNNLSDEEMALISQRGEIDSLLPGYIYDDPKYYNRYVSVVINYLFKYISNKILIKGINEVLEYPFECLAYQQLKGAYHIFLGFAGKGNSLLALANPFGKKDFKEMSTGVYESVCELINCVNGLYASELSNEDVYLDISVPDFHSNQKLISNHILYCIQLTVEREEIDLLISFNTDIEII